MVYLLEMGLSIGYPSIMYRCYVPVHVCQSGCTPIPTGSTIMYTLTNTVYDLTNGVRIKDRNMFPFVSDLTPSEIFAYKLVPVIGFEELKELVDQHGKDHSHG